MTYIDQTQTAVGNDNAQPQAGSDSANPMVNMSNPAEVRSAFQRRTNNGDTSVISESGHITFSDPFNRNDQVNSGDGSNGNTKSADSGHSRHHGRHNGHHGHQESHDGDHWTAGSDGTKNPGKDQRNQTDQAKPTGSADQLLLKEITNLDKEVKDLSTRLAQLLGGSYTAPDTPPVNAPPVDTPPVDTPPVDSPPVDSPPVDTPPVDTPPVNNPITSPNGKGFEVSDGKLTVNGQVLAGVNVTSQYIQQEGAAQAAALMKSEMPGINSVRLMTSPDGGAYSADGPTAQIQTVADIVDTVKAFNDQGIAVIIDNHAADANNPNSAAASGNEAAWFGQLAQAELGNNQVMFQPLNEPMGSNSDIFAEQQAAYNAIRATGSNAVVAFDEAGGGYAGPLTDNAAALNTMTNIAIDAHSYAGGSATGAEAVQAYQTEIAQTAGLTQAGGAAIPVFDGEIGNTLAGENDPGFQQLGDYVASSGMGAQYFTFSGGNGTDTTGDNMTNADGSLNSYGQQVAAWIRQANPTTAA